MSNKEKQKKQNKKKKDIVFYTVIISLVLILLVGITIALFWMKNNKKEDTKILGYTELIKKIEERSSRKNRNDSRKYFY